MSSPPPPRAVPWPTGLLPPALVALVATGLTLALLGLAPWELGGTRVVSAFHDGHVWAFEHIWRMILGSEAHDGVTTRIGYPGPVLVRFIAWAPALMVAPLQPLLGPLGAYNLALVVSPGLAALAAWGLLRRASEVDRWSAAGLALAYALCPYALGVLQSGQVAKLQHWLLPACLLAVSWAIRGPRRPLGMLACALGGLTMAFTTPSTALFLPLAGGLWALAELPGPRPIRGRALAAPLALGAMALGMLPAKLYLGDLRRAGRMLAFEPRSQSVLDLGSLPYPAPVAQPEGLLLGQGGLAQQAQDASHVVYLGLPLLILALVAGCLRRRGSLAGWGLLVLGVVLALGPVLVTGDDFALWQGRRLRLPAYLLELLHYPTRDSGMYYRAVLLAALGLPLLLASAWPARPRALWIALAWGLGLAQVADGWRISRALWPPPSGPVPGVALLQAMAADPVPGAVLDLPVEGGSWEGGNAMIASTIHGRATTGLPRQTSRSYLPQTARLGALVDQALGLGEPAAAGALLAERGYRYLCWRPWLDDPQRLPALEGSLGPPLGDAELYCWPLEGSPSP
jgi:hypothetical protein